MFSEHNEIKPEISNNKKNLQISNIQKLDKIINSLFLHPMISSLTYKSLKTNHRKNRKKHIKMCCIQLQYTKKNLCNYK